MIHELILLRHAKSAWPVGVRDSDRPLSARGIRDATTFGRYLAEDDRRPDAVVVSPATRTRQTWGRVAPEVGILESDAVLDERLYAASWWDVMDVVRGLPASASRVLVIGHNPAMEDIAGQLANDQSNRGAVRELRAKFPTCAAATVHSDLDWRLWGGQCGELAELWTPRGHAQRR
ncbi:MAG: histidine phosphatase family protein [Candidatus Nanopelagicales bacterium]